MAGLRDLLNKGKDNAAIAQKIAEPLKKEFPTVADVLGGVPAKGDQEAVSAGTITIFIHDGRARFSANVKSQEKTFIGEILDLRKPWESIEKALSTGEVSSKRYTERNGSYSKEQKDLLL